MEDATQDRPGVGEHGPDALGRCLVGGLRKCSRGVLRDRISQDRAALKIRRCVPKRIGEHVVVVLGVGVGEGSEFGSGEAAGNKDGQIRGRLDVGGLRTRQNRFKCGPATGDRGPGGPSLKGSHEVRWLTGAGR